MIKEKELINNIIDIGKLILMIILKIGKEFMLIALVIRDFLHFLFRSFVNFLKNW